MEPLEEHVLQEGRTVFLRMGLSREEVKSILATIKDNANVFTSEHKDMVGIDPRIA